ncbi:MAG: hypothetical protein EHM45_23340 [Desulfobacteraceae bacterium]|nr:MAG: hypothetical protein EHM45_23340 [Desulfobacteraceae bacterium]
MGLDKTGIHFLRHSQKMGVDFARTAMIGRQTMRQADGSFASSEDLLFSLGAKEVHSFDKSGYEGATHIFDLNKPIPATFFERYSVVLDGGSLEHIFNFPVAIKNCMEMLCVGGHYLSISPANNFFGHGFYQFGPEAYSKVFAPDNGFKMVFQAVCKSGQDAEWHSIGEKNHTSTTNAPLYLLTIAKRMERAAIFGKMPIQEIYEK